METVCASVCHWILGCIDSRVMPDATELLEAIQRGDAGASERLLPMVYDALRRLAAKKMANERPGHSLDATALVHEAYLRLVKGDRAQEWHGRNHFFAAAAEAMRRILVEKARRRQSSKRGGRLERVDLAMDALPATQPENVLEVLAIHEALDHLAVRAPRKAELVKLRYFLGCTIPEAAEILDIAPATAEEDWTYAKAWLRRQLGHEKEKRPLR